MIHGEIKLQPALFSFMISSKNKKNSVSKGRKWKIKVKLLQKPPFDLEQWTLCVGSGKGLSTVARWLMWVVVKLAHMGKVFQRKGWRPKLAGFSQQSLQWLQMTLHLPKFVRYKALLSAHRVQWSEHGHATSGLISSSENGDRMHFLEPDETANSRGFCKLPSF